MKRFLCSSKKKVVIFADGKTAPVHHPLAARERPRNLGINIWVMAPSTGEVASVDVAD